MTGIFLPRRDSNTLRIGTTGASVYMTFKHDRLQGVSIGWEAALEIGQAIFNLSRTAEEALKKGQAVNEVRTLGRQSRVTLDAESIIVTLKGYDVMVLSWQNARGIGSLIIQHARRAEGYAKAPQIILDQATLIRAGKGVGLAIDPVMLDEAEKAARYDTALRRYIRNPIYAGNVGVPDLRKLRKRKDQSHEQPA